MKSMIRKEAEILGCPFSFNNPSGQAVSYKCISAGCLAWEEDALDHKGYCTLLGTKENR